MCKDCKYCALVKSPLGDMCYYCAKADMFVKADCEICIADKIFKYLDI